MQPCRCMLMCYGSGSQIILFANILITFSFPISHLLPHLSTPPLPLFFFSGFPYLFSLFRMLTAWLGICWAPGSLNQSRASLTECAHTCPDRNDNDRDQSPPICPVSTVMSLFWNAQGGVWVEAMHSDVSVNSEPELKGNMFRLELKYIQLALLPCFLCYLSPSCL